MTLEALAVKGPQEEIDGINDGLGFRGKELRVADVVTITGVNRLGHRISLQIGH